MSTPPATLYANSRTPIFLDNVRITLGAPGEQPLISQARLAVANYENGIGTIVFSSRAAIKAFGHAYPVRLDQLTLLSRPQGGLHQLAADTLEHLPVRMRVTPDQDGLNLLAAERLRERRKMLRAEEAIGHSAIKPEGHDSAHFARLASKARETALTRLSRLSDAEALSVIEGNRLPGLDGSSFPIVSIEDVQKRRAHLRAAARMMERLSQRAGSVQQRSQEAAQAIQQYACGSDLNWNGSAAQECKARSRALHKLSKLSDSEARRVIVTNPVQDLDGSFPLAAINEVRRRRRYRHAGLRPQAPQIR
jgi:hypothetical protein